MKSSFFYASLAVVAVLLIAVFSLLPGRTQLSSDQLRVSATIFPLQDLVARVGGDHVDVDLILDPGASPHTFELTPRRVADLSSSNALFAIGHGIDDWATGIASANKTPMIILDEQVHLLCEDEEDEHHEEDGHDDEEDDHGHAHNDVDGCDPHYWLSIDNMASMAAQVAADLSDIDPEHAETYATNAATYQIELKALQEELQQQLVETPSQDLIVFHDSWDYLAEDLGLTLRGSFEPAPGVEPTPRELADLTRLVQVYNIRRVYAEPQLSDAVLQAFMGDLDLELGILDPIGGQEDRASYADLMRFNVHAITSPTQP